MKSLVDNGNAKVLTDSGWVEFRPRQTTIVEVHDCGGVSVIRENYMKFNGSNVYAIDENLRVVWEAQLPHPSDIFANILVPADGGFETSTWNGIRCLIDVKTGMTTKLGITK